MVEERKTAGGRPTVWRIVLLGILSLLSIDSLPAQATGSDDEIDWAKAREFWSFKTPATPPTPKVTNRRWPSETLDHFVLAGLEKKGLAPAAQAEKRTLIRRVTFDLTGLPPTPKEVAAFLADKRSDAYERLVDRLLGSYAFGERMASLWLPLARYAEDQAHQVGDDTQYFYPNAYKYREWVIDAFNRNLPYDQFILCQLAADKLPNARTADLPALGFVGLGPKYYNRDKLEVQADEWEDRVDTVCRTFLGLTVACARCHDHKFDPITTRDYYAMAGVFASTRMVNKDADGKAIDTKASESKGTDGKKVKKELPADALHMIEDGDAKDLNVFIRGNVERKGPVVSRRFLRVLAHGEPAAFKEGSGRRELAMAIADRENPVTARVIVNRMWGWFFGQPIVPTPSNFGHSGQPPSDPQLLDFLATHFMDSGWNMKKLIREMMLSSTYRQSSLSADNEKRDPSNSSLSRMNRRRLTVEQWRDAVLFVSGDLQAVGGKSLELDNATNFHRTVYARVSRLKLNDTLVQFDYPDANVHAEKRSVTTTPMQKLFLLNNPFMMERAKSLVRRVEQTGARSDRQKIAHAYEILFAREPERSELNLALAYLRKPVAAVTELSRWEQYAQMLLASNEMFYVD